jgi:hypothetical protein
MAEPAYWAVKLKKSPRFHLTAFDQAGPGPRSLCGKQLSEETRDLRESARTVSGLEGTECRECLKAAGYEFPPNPLEQWLKVAPKIAQGLTRARVAPQAISDTLKAVMDKLFESKKSPSE